MDKDRNALKARRLTSLCALSAAGVAAAGGQEAEAGIIYTSVNENIGFAAGNSSFDAFSLAGGHNFLMGTLTFYGFSRTLAIAGTTAANFKVKTQIFSGNGFGGLGFARPLNAGVKFGSAPGGATSFAYMQFVSSSGGKVGPGVFTDKYYAFSFVNAGTTLYGWIQGSMTNTSYDGLSYRLTGYAYEDTGIQIATGQRALASVPEPAALSMSLLGGALVTGAAGIRRWKKARADEAITAA